MQRESLDNLLVEQLRHMYDAEKQIAKALPRMVKKATSKDLKEALEDHLKETEGQIQKLEEAFEELELSPRRRKCQAVQGLIEEGKELMQLDDDPVAVDMTIVVAAQSVEHYEIGNYATALSYADMLGYESIADILEEILEEEEGMDDRLYNILEEMMDGLEIEEE